MPPASEFSTYGFWLTLLGTLLSLGGVIFSFQAKSEARQAKNKTAEIAEKVSALNIVSDLEELAATLSLEGFNFNKDKAFAKISTLRSKIVKHLESIRLDDEEFSKATLELLESLNEFQESTKTFYSSADSTTENGFHEEITNVSQNLASVIGKLKKLKLKD